MTRILRVGIGGPVGAGKSMLRASCDVNVTDVDCFAFPNAPNIGL